MCNMLDDYRGLLRTMGCWDPVPTVCEALKAQATTLWCYVRTSQRTALRSVNGHLWFSWPRIVFRRTSCLPTMCRAYYCFMGDWKKVTEKSTESHSLVNALLQYYGQPVYREEPILSVAVTRAYSLRRWRDSPKRPRGTRAELDCPGGSE